MRRVWKMAFESLTFRALRTNVFIRFSAITAYRQLFKKRQCSSMSYCRNLGPCPWQFGTVPGPHTSLGTVGTEVSRARDTDSRVEVGVKLSRPPKDPSSFFLSDCKSCLKNLYWGLSSFLSPDLDNSRDPIGLELGAPTLLCPRGYATDELRSLPAWEYAKLFLKCAIYHWSSSRSMASRCSFARISYISHNSHCSI